MSLSSFKRMGYPVRVHRTCTNCCVQHNIKRLIRDEVRRAVRFEIGRAM
jgi:hypothetical protein